MAPPATLPAVLIFAATYLVLAVGRLPRFRVDRTGAAIIGATLVVALNILTVPEAIDAINTDTIILLFGMMIVVANLRLSGIFALVTEWVIKNTHGPMVLLAAIVTVSGVFSAFFVNDTMCLVLTPLVLDITTHLRRLAGVKGSAGGGCSAAGHPSREAGARLCADRLVPAGVVHRPVPHRSRRRENFAVRGPFCDCFPVAPGTPRRNERICRGALE